MLHHNEPTMLLLEVRGGIHDGEKIPVLRSRIRSDAIITVPRTHPARDLASGTLLDDDTSLHVDVYRVVHTRSALYLAHVEDRLMPVDARARSMAA